MAARTREPELHFGTAVCLELFYQAVKARSPYFTVYTRSNMFKKMILARVKFSQPALLEIARVSKMDIDLTKSDDNTFSIEIQRLVDKYQLQGLFAFNPQHDQRPSHHGWHPTSFDFSTGASNYKNWTSKFIKLPLVQQILSATLIWLYIARIGDWHIPHHEEFMWTTDDALFSLRKANAFEDWMKLFLLYRPWPNSPSFTLSDRP